MRPHAIILTLAIPALAGGLAAQSCLRVAASANWGETHRVTRLTPTTVAILVPGLAVPETICQVELYCYTRSPSPVLMPVWIYDRSSAGAPGSPLGSGTMLVGTSAAGQLAQLQAPVPAGADFFIVFDNAVGNLAPPIALGGTRVTHYHTPPSWSGPFNTAAWIYRVYGSRGTMQGTFTRTGPGCPGEHGVPRIGAVGTPVIGSVFQVTVAQAPSSTSLLHLIGTVPAQLGLDPIGAPGCIVEQLPLITVALTAGSTGAASFSYGIRNDRSLVGAELRAQWLVVDLSANRAGLTVSQGGVITIGDF